jgi:UDP-N-acetylglucosamine--N-acetylmuramyl-(pentapeptide) pyrophosphoryl-undecaprenol N-acetylglucosamine transferase
VPLADASADHQAANAAAAAGAGAAITLREADWQCDPLAAQTTALLRPAAWTAAAAAARRLARTDAAERIVADCEASMAGRW